jgi:DASH complex subunit DAD2
LSARIAAKKAELENLRQLRDLSGTLATQMQALETKVSTLNDGTEGYTPSDSVGMAADCF